jgi:6-phosphogluconate dehydrogenase
MVGLGRMGSNIALRLMRDGHRCVGYDVSQDAVSALTGQGATGAASLEELVASLPTPRTVWLMLPAGEITERSLTEVVQLLEPGDAVVDGGNTHYVDDLSRAAALEPLGIHYVDVGVSGGVFGLDRGYCLMVGGDDEVFERLEPVFRSLAPGVETAPRTRGRVGEPAAVEHGYLHCGPVGAGHFVKMIHNGIEYGLMQAYAEGFDIFRNANLPSLPEGQRYDLDLADIAEVWRRGSVVSSWLLDLTASALAENPDLSNYSGVVQDSGEGRWTVLAAIEEAVPVHVLAASLFDRFRSRQEHTFGDKVLSAMRYKFGGHVEPPADGKKEKP